MPDSATAEPPPGTTPPAATASNGGAAAEVHPGEQMPTSPPEAKAEFSPNFTPPLTHDLRTQRKELAAIEALRPVDPNADATDSKQKLVSIPLTEYERLQGLEDFKILAADFSTTEMPAEEVRRVIKTYEELIADSKTIDEEMKQQSANVAAVIPAAVGTEPKRRGWDILKKVLLIAVSIVVTHVMVYMVGYVRGAKPVENASANRLAARRGYYPTIGGWNVAVNQLARGTGQRVLWITTDPLAEQYTWEVLGALAKARRQIDVVAIVPNTYRTELINLARTHGVTLHISDLEVNHINLCIFDGRMILDGSNSTAVWDSQDPADVDNFNKAVGSRIFPRARKVWQP